MINRIKEYFYLSLSQQRVFSILLSLCLLMLAFRMTGAYFIHTSVDSENSEELESDQEKLRTILSYYYRQKAAELHPGNPPRLIREESKPINYFMFDPNTLDREGWLKLGVSSRLARTIQNFLASGGEFREAGDLLRIYGFDENLYHKLEPYVQIQTPDLPEMYLQTHYEPQRICLNTADTLELQNLYGVGRVFANRIFQYRERLGGYADKSQLLDVFGMEKDRFLGFEDQLEVNTKYIRRLNINQSTFGALVRHPYIDGDQANAIIRYREQHGSYQKSEDLKQIYLFDEASLKKLKPYLSFEK